MGRFKPTPEEVISVPTWVLTFGDMVTNLMACFVMLQAMASTQDHTLFNAGLGSFRRAISQYGLPDWMFGKEDRPEHGYRMPHYPTEEAEEKEPDRVRRIIDAEDEYIRQTFKKLQDQLDTRSDEMPKQAISEVLTPIQFPPGSYEIAPADQAWLERFVQELKQNVQMDDVTLYVIGLWSPAPATSQPGGPAPVPASGSRAEMLLSARRAGSAEAVLRKHLATEIQVRRWQVDSWSTVVDTALSAQPGATPTVVIFVRGTGNSHGQ